MKQYKNGKFAYAIEWYDKDEGNYSEKFYEEK